MKNLNQLAAVVLAFAVAFMPVALEAQTVTQTTITGQVLSTASGTMTAGDSTNACNTSGACVTLNVGPIDQTASLVLSGTWSGTVTFEAQTGNGQWTQINGPTFQAGAAVGTTTGNGGWTFDVAGKSAIRSRMSTFSSGTATVSMSSSQAQSRIGELAVPQSLNSTSTPTFAAVQINGISKLTFLASDFTTSGVGTNLEPTALSFTFPANTAYNYPIHCAGTYMQNVATAAVTFGVQLTVAPTTSGFAAIMGTTGTGGATGTSGAFGENVITTATSAGIVTGTPNAGSTPYAWTLDGFIENPSTTANIFTINVKTATAADTVTVKRDSYCALVL